MITLIRTTSNNSHFIELVKQLDALLTQLDGEEHTFYAQFNSIDVLKQVVVAYEADQPVGCGAIKPYEPGSMEVKRMYTLPQSRNKGVASTILLELEQWAAELGYQKCVLETGIRQPEAIALYHKTGYQRIPNYGQYAGVENSVCFEKVI